MSKLYSINIFFVLLICRNIALAENADIIVAKDGTGHFNKIQSAIDSVPPNASKTWVILIKNGEYHEKLFITKNNIALVGEDRDSTRIVYAELRRIWRANHGDNDWGAAVINIGNNVHDLTIANLTIYNNYGSLYDDHDHQFAIRGGGNCTRIIIVNCNVLADGGDTISLWNTSSGMYYHANCFFSGYVDYVCPRGWCYITDSKFFGSNTTASIWHDGSLDSTSKLVIRNSYFDGVQNFPLGRNHRDGQFYLIDCKFSKNMADRPIYQVFESSMYKWGKRYYYFNCTKDGGDFSWFNNNLDSAYEGLVNESEITASWTFKRLWDPERTMPAVLTFASIPTPRNNHYSVDPNKFDTLRWIGGRNAISYNLSFGDINPPPFLKNINDNFYVVKELSPGTTYYWRVDVVTEKDTIIGNIWKFSTIPTLSSPSKSENKINFDIKKKYPISLSCKTSS